MPFKITDREYAPLSAETLQMIELVNCTVALVDLDAKTYETMSIGYFFDANEDGFSPFEAIDMVSTILLEGYTDFSAGQGMNYRLVLVDLAINNTESWEFCSIEHDVDLLDGFEPLDNQIPRGTPDETSAECEALVAATRVEA